MLSSDLAPYREAFAGFLQEMEGRVAQFTLGEGDPRLSRQTGVVVTFGSKAALREYPVRIPVVLCMAPVAQAEGGADGGQLRVRIHMVPDPGRLVDALRQLQPDLRRLAALSVLTVPGGYLDALRSAAQSRGVQLLDVRLADAGELPERLRQLSQSHVDALWLPPDPLLINTGTFAVLKEYSSANDVPFYAPTAGFVEAGAVAAVAPSFRHIGAAAAAVAQRLLAGRPVDSDVYPSQSETTLNLSAARRSGLEFAEGDMAERADRIVGRPD